MSFLFALLIASAFASECYDDLLISNVHIIATTANREDAGSYDSPDACWKFKSTGQEICYELKDLVGLDFMYGKSSWWTMANWNGYKLCDLESFAFKAGGSDAWAFTGLYVIVMGNDDKAYMAVLHEGDRIWIDSNWDADMRKHVFSIMDDFGKPKGDSSDAKIQAVYMIAHSKDDTGDGANLHIKSNNIEYEAYCYNINSQNDMEINKSDVWKWTNEFRITDFNQISQISVSAGGSDGWKFDQVAIIIKTNMGYYIPTLENGIMHSVNTNGGAEFRRAYLSMLPRWNLEHYDPADIARGGYWKFVHQLDPFATITLSQTASFYSEKGTIEEESRMQGFSDSYSEGGSFSMCGNVGGSIGPIDLGGEACTESNWSHDSSSSWETTVTSSIDSRITQGVEYSCEQTFECPAPTIIKPEDLNDVVLTSGACFIYQWITFVQNEATKHIEILETCEFDLILVAGHAPMCVPGQLIAETDSQTCYDGPQPPKGGTSGEESAIADALLDHLENNFTIYALLSLALAAGSYYRYRVNNKDDYKLMEMSRMDETYQTA